MVKLTETIIKTRIKSESLDTIKKLNVWGCDIEDISVLASFPSIEVLSLSVNRICSLKPLQYLPNLRECYLRKNDIEDLSEAEYLRDLTKLRVLWLDDNPCSDEPNYRQRVIQICPFLTTLDNRFVTKEEVEAAVPGYVRPSTPPPEPHPHQRRVHQPPADPPRPPVPNNYVQQPAPTEPMGEVGFYNPGLAVMTPSMSQSFHQPSPPAHHVLQAQHNPHMAHSYHPSLQHQHSTPEQQMGQQPMMIPQAMSQSFHPAQLVYQPTQPVPVQQPLDASGGGFGMSQSLYGSLPTAAPGFQSMVQAKLSSAHHSPQPEEAWLGDGFDELAEERTDDLAGLADSFQSRLGVRRSLTRNRQQRSRSVSPSRLQRQENVLTAILHLMEDLDADGLRLLIDQAHERIKKQR